MKKLLVVLFLIVAGVVGLGFYREWFTVGWDKADGKGHLTGTVDDNKIRTDQDKAVKAVQGLGHSAKDKAASPIVQETAPVVPRPAN